MGATRDLVKKVKNIRRNSPVETLLILLAIALFCKHLFSNAMFWLPPKYLSSSSIHSDLYSCSSESSKTNFCPVRSIKNDAYKKVEPEINETLLRILPEKYSILPGGIYKPLMCDSQYRVAVIIPYRDRESQLKIFLQHMHPLLSSQAIEYVIVVVEQGDTYKFNRGKLFNVGFVETLKKYSKICCFIFHDVDLLPENLNNLYACSKSPRHMSVAVNTFRYHLLYPNLFGGVIAMRRDQFKKVNGFSNIYWSWGGEDDDLASRLIDNGLTTTRWEPRISRYFMLSHKKETASPARQLLLDQSLGHWKDEGLSSLRYRVLAIDQEPLFTRILADLSV